MNMLGKYLILLIGLLTQAHDLLGQSMPAPHPRTNKEYRIAYRKYTKIAYRRWQTGLGPYYRKPFIISQSKRKKTVDWVYDQFVSIEDFDSLRAHFRPLALVPKRIAELEENIRYSDSLYQATGDTIRLFFIQINQQMIKKEKERSQLTTSERIQLYERALLLESNPEMLNNEKPISYFDQQGNEMQVQFGIQLGPAYSPKQMRQLDR